MKNSEVKNIAPGVDWVGVLDLDIVTFDVVMETKYGTTYKSYLVRGKDKIALIETAKVTFWEDYIEKIKSLIDPALIDYIVMDHTEPDHAGSLVNLLALAPKAQVVASGTALRYLADITNIEFSSKAVKEGDSLDLGGKTLQFISAPNLHWPDSMYTYLPEDQILFTCDSFGSHFANQEVFDDLVGNFEDAFKYYFYAILRPFSRFLLKAIEKVNTLKIKVICPGHGPILRSYWRKYVDWSKTMSEEFVQYPLTNRVMIAYVSAYGYTGALAGKIAEGLKSAGLDVDICNVENMSAEEISSHLERASAFIFGSSTINQNALPPIYSCFALLSPIRDRAKLAGAFGSFGWSGEAKQIIESNIQTSKLAYIGESYFVKFKPSEKELQGAVDYGVRFAQKML
ncbi:MAG: FprA family A-type flavoprotein [Bacteroidales bacterium]